MSGPGALSILNGIMSRSFLASHAGPARNADLRACDHPGCAATGEFRAPRSRAALNQFYWFCLDHVRAYNAAWNYYAGMSMDEIEQEIRHDTVWQRPTWPFGTRLYRYAARFKDSGLFGFEDEAEPGRNGNGAKHHHHPASPEARALAVFDLEPPVSLPGLKTRYKELVKLHHPDVAWRRQGCRRASQGHQPGLCDAQSLLRRHLNFSPFHEVRQAARS